MGEPDAGAEAADADEPVRSAGETAALVSSGAGGTAEMKSEAGSSSVFIVPVVRKKTAGWRLDRKMGGRWPTEGGARGPQISGVYSVVRSPRSVSAGVGMLGVVAYTSLIVSRAAGPGRVIERLSWGGGTQMRSV